MVIRILDETGQLTAARIRCADLSGQYYAPVGHQADFPITEANDPVPDELGVLMDDDRRFAYVEGELAIEFPRQPAQVEGAFNYESWIQALNAGKTFVTNTPFLTMHINDQGPGSTLQATGAETYQIVAEVWSQRVRPRFDVPKSSILKEKSDEGKDSKGRRR